MAGAAGRSVRSPGQAMCRQRPRRGVACRPARDPVWTVCPQAAQGRDQILDDSTRYETTRCAEVEDVEAIGDEYAEVERRQVEEGRGDEMKKRERPGVSWSVSLLQADLARVDSLRQHWLQQDSSCNLCFPGGGEAQE